MVDEAVRTLGVEPGQIAKTMVVVIIGELIIFALGGAARIEVDCLATSFGAKPKLVDVGAA